MPTPDPILAQRVADLLGRLSVIESLLPQIKDSRLRSTFTVEVIHLKNMITELQN
jgi:hypothetical protein